MAKGRIEINLHKMTRYDSRIVKNSCMKFQTIGHTWNVIGYNCLFCLADGFMPVNVTNKISVIKSLLLSFETLTADTSFIPIETNRGPKAIIALSCWVS